MSADIGVPFEPAELCAAFGLGEPGGEPVRVTGGLSHGLWRFGAGTEQYAVKVLNTSIDHLNVPYWREMLAEAIDGELAAYRAGIPMPQPIPVATDPRRFLADITNRDGAPITVRVHEWVTGRPVPDDTTDPAIAAGIGTAAARLHGLALPSPHSEPAGFTDTEADGNLKAIAKRAAKAGFDWADAAEATRSDVDKIRGLSRARYDRDWPVITTHRDLTPKNVLIDAEGAPLLIDWDVTGPWTAQEEIACAAMEFAGVMPGAPSREAVAALLSAYREAGGRIGPVGPEVFAGWLIKLANWTQMHVRQAVADPDARIGPHPAAAAAPFLLKLLHRLVTGVDEWSQWLSDPETGR